jgi:MFS family permease
MISTLDPQTRRNMGVLFITGILFWSSMTSMLPALSPYIKHLGANNQQLGIVVGAFAIGLLLCRPQMGRMADRRGRKIVLLIGIAVAAIAPLGYLLIPNALGLIPIRIFHGLSIAAFTTAYSALVADLSPPQNRGELMGYMSLGHPIGMAIGPALGGVLLEWTDFAPVFFMAAGLSAISWLCAAQVQSPDLPPPAPAAAPAPKGSWQVLLSDRIRIPTLTMVFVGVAVGTILTFVPLFIQAAHIPLNAGLFYTAAAVTSFGIRLVTGRASDRWGRGGFITLGLVFYLVAMALLWQAHTPQAVIVAGLVEGMAGGMFLPIMITLIADRCHPYERGRIFGLCIAGFDLGIALAGPCLGYVADSIGYQGLFGVATLVVLASLLIFTTQSSKDLRHSVKFALGQGQDVYALPIQGLPSGN